VTRAAVFGTGNWGTAFSLVLADSGTEAVLCGRRAGLAERINRDHENPEYLPGIALPVAGDTHRLVHLHQNVPGVLAAINRVLADHGVNVEGQLLGTRDEYGYVLTDIGSEYSEDVLAQLSAMPVTIRLRTLRSP